jgi:hypothetical protein
MYGMLPYLLCMYSNLKIQGLKSQNFGPTVLKIQATATIAYGGLLFPPERGEHGPPFPLAQVEAVSDYPTIRSDASNEKLGLD